MKTYTILIGIDDTDNPNTRGTGYQSRQMAKVIHQSGLGRVKCITRHQLFFDPRVPYTSQNSSACLVVETMYKDEIIKKCRDFLLDVAAEGSDVGLAVADESFIDKTILEWGRRTKIELVSQIEAKQIAKSHNIYLEGLTGTKDGIIGALAAIGLRKGGNDGRCIWLDGKEIRDLEGIYTAKELLDNIYIDSIVDLNNCNVNINSKISVGEWVRPAIVNNKITIFVESSNKNNEYEFQVATKEYIKSITD